MRSGLSSPNQQEGQKSDREAKSGQNIITHSRQTSHGYVRKQYDSPFQRTKVSPVSSTMGMSNLIIEKGQLQSQVKGLIGADKIKAYRQLAVATSQIRQQERNDLNWQQHLQDKNIRITLNSLYKNQIVEGRQNISQLGTWNMRIPEQKQIYIRNNELAMDQGPLIDLLEFQKSNLVKQKKVINNRDNQPNQKRMRIKEAIQNLLKFQTNKFPINVNQAAQSDHLSQADIVLLRKNHFSSRNQSPKMTFDLEPLETNEYLKQFQQTPIKRSGSVTVHQKQVVPDRKSILMPLMLAQEQQINNPITNKRATLLSTNQFMNKINQDNMQIYSKKNQASKDQIQTMEKFDSMVAHFDQKRIKDLAREFQPKSRNNKYAQIRVELLKTLLYLNKLRLHTSDLLTQVIFSSKPFQKPLSYELIYASKTGNESRVKELLLINRYLVYDFDYIYMTALHWACKRGHLSIVEYLIEKGADIDFQDIIERAALYFAIVSNNNDIVQVLLDNQASPWSTAQVNYNLVCEEFNPSAMIYVSRSRKLHMALAMLSPDQRGKIWKKLQRQTKILYDY